jgi:hypothetical protein
MAPNLQKKRGYPAADAKIYPYYQSRLKLEIIPSSPLAFDDLMMQKKRVERPFLVVVKLEDNVNSID